MSKKMKKNSFVEGAMVGYVAILLSKVMGALYSIPFYNIIGEKGGVIYSCAYTIYSLFLEISTSGIPIALSIVVSEFNAKGMFRSKQRTYTLTLRFISIISVLCFLAMQIFAKGIGLYFLGDMEQGVTADEIALGVRMISFCLLIVPFLSLRRGYLQGHKIMAAPSTSQVIEQFVRIAVVLVGAYTVVKVLEKGETNGVAVALLGATAGAVAAYLYLFFKTKHSTDIFYMDADKNEIIASDKEIIKKVVTICVTIVLITVTESIYRIVDLKMILYGLNKIGYADIDAQEIASISSTWIPKIGMIISALSMGITNSIAPHLSEKKTRGNMKEVNDTLNQAISGFLMISIPLGFGLFILSSPVYNIFYGASDYGSHLLKLAVIVNIIGSLVTIVCMSMQSIGKGKLVCVYSVVGIVVNAVFDLPLIYLCDKIGYAYLGASVSSVIGQCTTFTLLLISLKKHYKFGYGKAITVLGKILPASIALIIGVIIVASVYPVIETRGVTLLIQMAVYALAGGVPYGIVILLNKGLYDVIGKNETDKLLMKLHLKK